MQTIDILRDYALQYPRGFELSQSTMTWIWLGLPSFLIECPACPLKPKHFLPICPGVSQEKAVPLISPGLCLFVCNPQPLGPLKSDMPDSVDIPAPLSAMAYVLSAKASAGRLTNLFVTHPTITVISKKLPLAPAFLL